MPSVRSTIAAAVLAVGLVAGVVATPARAALVLEGLFTPGDSLVARDTDSGLQWLNLQLTLGLSYNDVAGGAVGPFASVLPPEAAGGWYALGFRHATVAQVTTLYTNAGAVIPQSTQLFDPITLAPSPGFLAVQELLDKLGNTVFDIFNQPQPIQQGFVDFDVFDPLFVGAAVAGYTLTSAPPTMFANPEFFTLASQITKDDAAPSFGHYLVRVTAVPEPASWLLIGGGLTVLTVLRRRRRTKAGRA